jgi:probable HAF family extracellular repeat protein
MGAETSRRSGFVILATLAVLGGCSGSVTQVLQSPPAQSKSIYYVVQNLGSLGGRDCCGEHIAISNNNRGWVAGTSNVKGNKSFHPFLWRNGVMQDLGTLGGPNSGVGVMNDHGVVPVGGSDTGTPDPLGEDFCGSGTHQTCLSFLWENGKRTLVPTLGGNNNTVAAINNHGLVAAFAETKVRDPSCIAPQVLDYEAFTWDPASGKIHRLYPLKGDSVSEAQDINEQGDVVGVSGACGPVLSLPISNHAVLWRHGDSNPIDLGSLGGTIANTPYGVNNRGQVAGLSALKGNKTAHAFLWQNGKMLDLGALPGDNLSSAASVTDSGLVLVESGTVARYPRGSKLAVWENGILTNLNTLVRPPSSLHLIHWGWINQHGDVVGQAYDRDTGALVPFLATRCDPKALMPRACMQGNI